MHHSFQIHWVILDYHGNLCWYTDDCNEALHWCIHHCPHNRPDHHHNDQNDCDESFDYHDHSFDHVHVVSSALSSQSSRSVISIIIIMFAMINHPEHNSDHDYDHDSNHGDCCDDFDAGVDLCWSESLFVGKGSSCCNWLDLVVFRWWWWWRMMVVKVIMIMLITWSLMENPGAQEQWWEPGVLTHKWGQPPLSFQDYPDYMDYRE